MRTVERHDIRDERTARAIPFLPRVLIFVLMSLAFSIVAAAQTPDYDEPAPPPLRLISKGEKDQLNSQEDAKDRIEVALDLMDLRLKKAEERRTAEEFDAMFIELGGFHGLMDDTLNFLKRENRRTARPISASKKYEIGLRAFTPRLELIRRDLPGRYSDYLKKLLRYLRDARSKAIEPFFGNSVVPNSRNDNH
ncbi:MAG TPA: hypothetical protein VK468_09410 [Pyrinomonadaceae bacterium]|nr:hypothetical protein [Pyrinomonadaceae bacterium]